MHGGGRGTEANVGWARWRSWVAVKLLLQHEYLATKRFCSRSVFGKRVVECTLRTCGCEVK